MRQLITRKEAIAQGLKRYFTGRPCKRGHVAERVCPSGSCVECMPVLQREYRIKNNDYCREKERERYHKNPEHYKEKRRKMYIKHQSKRIAYSAEYREKNKDIVDEKRRIYMREYIKTEEGRAKIKSYRQKEHVKNIRRCSAKARKLSMKSRVPLWADLAAIRDFYSNRPEGYHVDHVIPLHGDNVSGLHVLENLQYLPAGENISKGNKYIPQNGR